MRILKTDQKEFNDSLTQLLQRRERLLDELSPEIEGLIQKYRAGREKFLIKMARENDGVDLTEKSLWIEADQIRSSHRKISAEVRKAIDHAKERVERYQSELKLSSFESRDETGVHWGTELRPLDRVGIYVPGGRANYFMTLLLCAVPARIAGVREILVATPPKKKVGAPFVDASLLYTAKLCGVERILVSGRVGALSAMAFGTSETAPVEKIVGSGGRRTAVTKSCLAGYVGTDGISGPLETAFLCDSKASFKNVASDIIGQADRDPEAEIFVLCIDEKWMQLLIDELAQEVNRITDAESRSGAQSCLEKNTTIILGKNMVECISISNRLACGLVCLVAENAQDLTSKIKACGSLLLGAFTPPVGLDLIGGPSGLVNTLGTAAFSVSMSPASFTRRFSVLEFDKPALERYLKDSINLAKAEGFETHENSFKSRFSGDNEGR